MKKRLLFSLLLALVICASLVLGACSSVNTEVLDRMLADLKETYPATAITNESYTLSVIKIDFDNDGNMTEVKIAWSIEGSTEITISDVDANDNVTVNIPTIRDNEIKYTLVGSLTDEKGNIFTNKEGEPYTAKFERIAQKTNVSQNTGASFRETIVKNPVADTAYVWGTYWGHEMYYFAGTTGSNTHNYATTKVYSEAVPVCLEAVTGGYRLYFMKDNVKTYIDMTTYDSGSYVSGSTSLVTDATQLDGVLTIDEKTGALKCETIVYKDITYKFYFAMRSQYPGEVRVADAQYLVYDDPMVENHTWNSNEPPMYLLSGETELPEVPTLTEAQILEQAFALGANEEMPGVIELTGVITEVVNSYTAYGTVKILVGDKTIECYKMVNNKDVKVSALKVGDKITVRGVLRNYTKDTTSKVEFDDGCTFVLVEAAPVVDPDPTPVDPPDTTGAITAAEVAAEATALNLEHQAYSENSYKVLAYVVGEIKTKDMSSGKVYDLDLADEAGGTKAFALYHGNLIGEAPEVGDKVLVIGHITRYNTTLQIGGNTTVGFATVQIVEKGEGGDTPTPSITSNVDKVAAADIAANTAYKLVMDHTGSNKQLYALNSMDGYYVASTADVYASANIYVEEVEGGYKLYFLTGETRNYLGAVKSGDYNNIKLNVESVWTITDEGISTKLDDTTTVWIGTAKDKTYSTFSLNTSSEIIAAYLATVQEGKDNATITATNDDHATIILGKTSGKAGETFTFTINVDEDYEIVSVKINNAMAPSPVEGVYTVTINAATMNVSVTVRSKDAQEGEVQTQTIVLTDYATTNSWQAAGAKVYDSIDSTAATISLTATPGSYGQNSGKYYVNNEVGNWRIYQNENPQIVIEAKTGYVIKSVTVKYNSAAGSNDATGSSGRLTNDGEIVDSEQKVTVNSTRIELGVGNAVEDGKKGNIQIVQIIIEYAEIA